MSSSERIESMICKHCGREIDDEDRICPFCKTPVIRIKVKKICAFCKTEIKRGDTVCSGCGRKVPEKLRELLAKEDVAEREENPEERFGQEKVDFPLLMLSLLPPVAALFFKVLFSKVGILPWYITALLVYFVVAMLVSYTMDSEIRRRWRLEKGQDINDFQHLFCFVREPGKIVPFFSLRQCILRFCFPAFLFDKALFYEGSKKERIEWILIYGERSLFRKKLHWIRLWRVDSVFDRRRFLLLFTALLRNIPFCTVSKFLKRSLLFM